MWEGTRGHTEDIDGRFELARAETAAAIPRLEFRSGIPSGRSVVVTERDEDSERHGIAAHQGEFQLLCVPRGAILIEVVDAESGAPLDEVEITTGSWIRSYPGNNPKLPVEAARSPGEVDLKTSSGRLVQSWGRLAHRRARLRLESGGD